MADKKDAFICYRSYIEAIRVLPLESRWAFFEKVVGYTLDATEPVFETDIENAMFTLMKANLDSCDQRFRTSVENGKKGGRPRKENSEKKPNSKPNNNLTENLKITYQNPNVNENENVNGNSHLHLQDDKNGVAVERSLTGAPPPRKRNELTPEDIARGWRPVIE